MKKFFFACLWLCITLPALGQDINAKLDSLLCDPLLETSQLGLMVWDLTDDSLLYQRNARQTMRPASTMKLITAITALHRLGGNYKLSTDLYYDGTISNGTLNGNVILVGGMDPEFDITDLRDFVECLQQQGVDTLRGHVVADCSFKDTLRWGEGWCWDDKNPTLSPLLINKKAEVAERFVEELTAASVYLDSTTIIQGVLPPEAHHLKGCRHGIDQVLLRMMKESDNLYAECVYYQLAASYLLPPARAIHARTLEKQLTDHLGLAYDAYRFADGSGLSLYNYVSAELLTLMLRYAWQTERIRQHLLPTLPIAGFDGTLAKRMRRTAAEGNVRAKTGTLTGVSSLAGYLTTATGHNLCFAIINQGALSGKEARAFQDRLCIALCEP